MAPEPKLSERRRHLRLARIERLFLQATVAPGEDAHRTLAGTTADVSADGMQICSATRLPEGCPVEIWIEAPGGKHGKLLLSGLVRWHQGPGPDAFHRLGVELRPQITPDRSIWSDLVRALGTPTAGVPRMLMWSQ